MEELKVGDLVRDRLNKNDLNYGLGVVVSVETQTLIGGNPYEGYPKSADHNIPGKRYDVYFNKFERTITFHGDYLERVSED